MTGFALTPPSQPSVAIHNTSERFPVRRIFCIGKNYADHVREMGGDPKSDPPVYFTKPADASVGDGAHIPYPPATKNLHYEAELVVAIGKGGKSISPDAAPEHIWGYGTGNDLTRRDLQKASKDAGRPWDMAKGFDNSAILGPLVPVADCGHLKAAGLRAIINGEIRQNSNISQMIWSVPEVISGLSELVALCPGDLIFTGTPEGVGPLVRNDLCRVEIDGLPPVSVTIT